METPHDSTGRPAFTLRAVFAVITILCILLAIFNGGPAAIALAVIAAIIDATLFAAISPRSRLVVVLISPLVGMSLTGLLAGYFRLTATDRLSAVGNQADLPLMLMFGAVVGGVVSFVFGVPLAVMKAIEIVSRQPQRDGDEDVEDDSDGRT